MQLRNACSDTRFDLIFIFPLFRNGHVVNTSWMQPDSQIRRLKLQLLLFKRSFECRRVADNEHEFSVVTLHRFLDGTPLAHCAELDSGVVNEFGLIHTDGPVWQVMVELHLWSPQSLTFTLTPKHPSNVCNAVTHIPVTWTVVRADQFTCVL
jgi:hypothetical protein